MRDREEEGVWAGVATASISLEAFSLGIGAGIQLLAFAALSRRSLIDLHEAAALCGRHWRAVAVRGWRG